MPHFTAFGKLNLQYEIKFGKKFLIKPQMTKTSQDNNWIIISKHFYEYLIEKLKYRDKKYII